MSIKLGFCICASFCTFRKVIDEMKKLKASGFDITPIMSENAYNTDTRFGKAEDFIKEIEEICQNKIIHTINEAEPIGPNQLLDILVIAPATGNTIGKLANGIADTSVTLATKAHLRNQRPVVIAISTNDALSGSAKNIGELQNRKHIFFVPYKQDNYKEKPSSIVADMTKIEQTVMLALENKQIQPIIL